MNSHRSNVHIFTTLLLMMILCLVDQFDHTTCHFGHFTLNRWPTIILKLCHFDCVFHLAIGNIEFTSRVIRTTFTLHILDDNVFVLDFIVGPVSRTFLRAITNLNGNGHFFYSKKCGFHSRRTIYARTSVIITIVLMPCSDIIRQKSPIVSSIGSCVMINDSELSYPSMNDAFM